MRLKRAKDEDFTSWRGRWERKVADLEEMNIKEGSQELFLEYMARIGANAAAEIRAH